MRIESFVLKSGNERFISNCFFKFCLFAGLSLGGDIVSMGESIAAAQTASDAAKTAPSQADTNVSPWLDELIPLLTFDVSGATPLEKQKAIADHVRKRPVSQIYKYYYASGKKPGITKGDRINAQLSLEHKFFGQPSYGPYFRGKDVIDWDTNPVADFEWIVQFHRLSGHQSLADMYCGTKDERYAAEWVFEVNSWINHMHNLPVPYRHPGWRTLDTAIRMLRWSMVFDDFVRSPSLDDKTLVSFLYSMTVHMERTDSTCQKANDSTKSLGNWDIHHAEALLVAAAAFPELKCSAKYLQHAAEYLVNFQRRVLLSDGVINEFIPSYHSPYPGNFSRLLRFVDGLKLQVTIPDDFRTLLEKSIDAVTIWSHPDATSPVFGDAWLGSPGGNRTWIRPYLDMFDRPDWIWFASNGKKGTHPASRMRELPVAGYYTMRSDWTDKALFVVLKNTYHVTGGKWHNQPDNMTFELSAYGQRLMTDSGCYNYSGEPKWRAWFRSPTAHQLVTLDDRSISMKGKKILDSSSDELDVLVVENEPVTKLTHRRTVLLLAKKYFIILDRLSGAASGKLRQHFQFMPGPCQFDETKLIAQTTPEAKDAVALFLHTANAPGISFEKEEGWISKKYMRKEPRPAFAFVQDKSKNQTCYFAAVLIPTKPGQKISPVVLNWSEEDNTISLSVGASEKYQIKVDPETSQCHLVSENQ